MVIAIKVFKKTSPNDKLVAYLGNRDFVDHLTHTAPINGVINVDNEYLKGRKVFMSVILTYRYGREEDQIMGLDFSKEFELVNSEISPKAANAQLSDVQKRLIEKLGTNTRPFSITVPVNAPTSVSLDPGDDLTEKPLGVLYELKFYVAESSEEKPQRRNSVTFAVRKVQFAPSNHDPKRLFSVVNRSFTLSPGKLNLEVGLLKDIYFHGEIIATNIKVCNSAKKTVKSIKAEIIQHVEITMTSNSFSRVVASIESCEGCPITPNTSFERNIDLTPLASNLKRFGIALDGQVKDEDANLASSTINETGGDIEDSLGINVSYSIRVKLLCGAISGELSAEVPFKLMHPDTQAEESKSGPHLEFEEFSNIRRGKSIDEPFDD